jgi:hypothetical protein
MAEHNEQLSAKAVINQLKIDVLPSLVFSQDGQEIIPYGIDNLYPNRTLAAIRNSPTAKGCVRRLRDFVFGLGFGDQADIVVNRDNETLNDILNKAVGDYSEFGGFALHFNYNLLGEIIEIFNADFEFIRKLNTFWKVRFGNWVHGQRFFDEDIDIFLYNPDRLKIQIEKSGGFDNFLGTILYFAHDGGIYPESFLQASKVSANFESDSQVFSNANIKNGFSGTTIIKNPSLLQGEEGVKNNKNLSDEIGKLHGADKAGSSVVVNVPVSVTGEMKPFTMVESLSPTNVDQLFTNQNEHAESSIFKEYRMPPILLGVSSSGMFNQASFNDAFNYKNADTEADRTKVQRVFNSFIENTIFGLSDLEIVPLEMKDTNNSNIQ